MVQMLRDPDGTQQILQRTFRLSGSPVGIAESAQLLGDSPLVAM